MNDTTILGSKNQLVDLIKQIVEAEDTGLVSILTNTKHAVLLKFFLGKLIHIHSRTRDISDVIQVLNESEWVKFKFANITMENSSELMPIDTFLDLIDSGIDQSITTQPNYATTTPESVTNKTKIDGVSDQLNKALVEVTSEYLGPVAELMVDEAFELSNDPIQVIEYLAGMITESQRAAEFRQAGLQAVRQYSE